MVDMSSRLTYAMELVDRGQYFCINRPRQFGKTTLLSTMARHLRARPEEYLLARISFEGLDDSAFKTAGELGATFIRLLHRSISQFYPEDLLTELHADDVKDFDSLSTRISRLARSVKQRIVVMIDEVDRAGSFDLFLRFLGMLRTKYLSARDGEDSTFHSVILAGLHDIKSLKLKIRGSDSPRFNSPWNIAVQFDMDMTFNELEIVQMLKEYGSDKDIEIDYEPVAHAIHDYTSGYPFLVSIICKMIDEDFKNHTHWTVDDVDRAFRALTYSAYTNTNFDDLAKTLYYDEDLYRLVHAVLFGHKPVPVASNDPIMSLAIQHGILVESPHGAKIHNRIYEAKIVDQMAATAFREQLAMPQSMDADYIADDGNLNVAEILRGYQRFIQEHHSRHDESFLEREGRLIFLAFLKPILNGRGYAFKEPAVGDERRLDVVLTYNDQREVVELKVWRGESYHKRGLAQLSEYLDHYALDHGFLLIYDFRRSKSFREETIEFDGKQILAVWV